MEKYPKYKGWYYEYVKEKDIWFLFDRIDKMGNLVAFNASVYRIDECFNLLFNNKYN
jgi:hypothetical protein